MARLLMITFYALFLLLTLSSPGAAQDEVCRTTPEPQCQCVCREVRSTLSVAPRGTCRVIESGGGSCQLRWFDAARGNQNLANADAAGAPQRSFLERVQSGALPTKAHGMSVLRVEALMEIVRRRDFRLPVDPTPLEVAAAYLALDPDRQEPEALLVAYLILLGPPIQNQVDDRGAAALVDYLFVEMKTILERVRSRSAPQPRAYRSDDIDLVDESARGCLELLIRSPKRILLMVKSPHATGSMRCRE